MRNHIGMKRVKGLWRHRLVVVPPDLAVGGGVPDHELVLGRPAGVLARQRPKRTMRCQRSLAPSHREFNQFGLSGVVSHQTSGAQAAQANPS